MLKRLIGNYGRTRISLLMAGILALGTLSPVSYAYAKEPEAEICDEVEEAGIREGKDIFDDFYRTEEEENPDIVSDGAEISEAEGEIIASGKSSGKSEKDNYEWVLYKNGSLYINGKGKLSSVAGRYKDQITKVYIGEGITKIENNTFRNWKKMQEVHIPDTVESIGMSAFKNCDGLSEVILPKKLKTLGNSAFRSCRSLKTVKWNRNEFCRTGDYAFAYCENLTVAEFLGVANNTNHGIPNVFSGCTNLKALYVGASIPYLEEGIKLDVLYYGGSGDTFNLYYKAFKEVFGIKKGIRAKKVIYNAEEMPLFNVNYDTDGRGTVPAETAAVGMSIHRMPQPEPYQVISGNEYFVSKWLRVKGDDNTEFRFGEEDVKETGEDASDVTLYAKWEKAKPVSVNFYITKDRLYKTETVLQGRKIEKPIEDPEREEYDFTGWYDTECTYEKGTLYFGEESEGKSHDFDSYVIQEEPVSIYAHWAEKGLTGYWTYSEEGITVSLNYTFDIEYDGRKHLWEGLKKPDTNGAAYDVYVGHMYVFKNRKDISSTVKIKNVKTKNNKESYFAQPDKSSLESLMKIEVKVEASDKKVTRILNDMLKGKNAPLIGCIIDSKFIDGSTLSSDSLNLNTELYTTEEVKKSKELQEKDNILVYNGKTKVTWDKKEGIATGININGLYCQKVYTDKNGNKKSYKIKLKPGRYKKKKKKDDSGEYYEWELPDKGYSYALNDTKLTKGEKTVEILFDGNFYGSYKFKRSEDDIAKDQ